MKELHHITNIFAKARQKEFIEHLYYYQLLYIFSGDGFQIPCLRKYEHRCTTAEKNNNFNNQIMNEMKNKTTRMALGFFALIAIGLTSCSEKQPTQDDIVKKNAETYVKEKMNDPASYEFVKLELIDSVTFSNNIEYSKDFYSKIIDSDRRLLEMEERYKTSIYGEKSEEYLKAEIEKNERILSKIDSLATLLGDRKNEVASYTYIFSFRGNNALGAKILNEYVVQTDPAPDFKIINMTDDKDKIFLNPNDFPGYREMIKKNL